MKDFLYELLIVISILVVLNVVAYYASFEDIMYAFIALTLIKWGKDESRT